MGWRGDLNKAGIDSDGLNVRIPLGDLTARNIVTRKAKVWYVYNGMTSSGVGKSWATAFKTIQEGVTAASTGDVVLIDGSYTTVAGTPDGFTEAVTISAAKPGLSIIGVANRKRTVWTAAADAVCLTIGAPDCLIENIWFRPPAYTSGTPAAIKLTTSVAYRTTIRKCRFQGKSGSYYGIFSGANADCIIEDNEFIYLNNVTTVNGTAISTGTSDCSNWVIRRNMFHSNIIDVDAQLRQSFVTDNYFPGRGLAAAGTMSATLTTKVLDISGAATGYNVVTGNFFGALYQATGGLFGGGTNDLWSGNFVADRTHDTEADDPTGISELVPA